MPNITSTSHQNFPIDFDNIYQILKKLESLQLREFRIENFEDLELDKNQLVYHLLKMKEAGLVSFEERRFAELVSVPYPEITIDGHEYLKDMSHSEVRKSVYSLAKKAGEISLHAIKYIASQEAMQFYKSL